MPGSNHERIIHQFFAESDRGNLAVIDDLIAPDFVAHFPATPGPINREGLRQFLGMLHSAFPDGQHRFDDQITEDDKVASRWTFQGTHQGEFQGIPPTGKTIAITGMTIDRVSNGQIIETWAQWDAVGMLQQLGAIPTG